MQKNFDNDVLQKIIFLAGDTETITSMPDLPPMVPFAEEILDFLNDVSQILMKHPSARRYPDVITFAFWIRRASLLQQKQRFHTDDGNLRFGRGLAFHIAPSNVPVNFAYSLAMGLLTGNSNIVRVPSRAFPQVDLIVSAVSDALTAHGAMRSRLALIRYGHDKTVNDLLSSVADTRIIWGGDATIAEVRASALPPRSTEITFADRYSISVIDSDAYMQLDKKSSLAEAFYNDTYLSDQNACTSPRIVIWTGQQKAAAKQLFWDELHTLVQKNYMFQDIQGVNKLTRSCLTAIREPGVKLEPHSDNLIIRMSVPAITDTLMEQRDNSGFFFEYDCDDIMDIKPLCDNRQCQTIGLLGDSRLLMPLLTSGIKGVDRVVPIGKTMDFELIWDGYDLVSQLTRIIRL